MKIILSLLAIICLSFFANGQCCKDPQYQADEFYQCMDPIYDPVCGCDGLTYRNPCAAEHWGGLINNGICLGWTEGTVCGNFDFELTPSGVDYFPVKFRLYSKTNTSAALYIYNRMGILSADFYFSVNAGVIFTKEINLETLEMGIYLAEVVINGEHLVKKFGKLADTN